LILKPEKKFYIDNEYYFITFRIDVNDFPIIDKKNTYHIEIYPLNDTSKYRLYDRGYSDEVLYTIMQHTFKIQGIEFVPEIITVNYGTTGLSRSL
jgi:hypothetical protein